VNRKAESWEDREPSPRRGVAAPQTLSETRSGEVAVWTGAEVRNIVGPGEVSAAGAPGRNRCHPALRTEDE
jgi:hypothetical protein